MFAVRTKTQGIRAGVLISNTEKKERDGVSPGGTECHDQDDGRTSDAWLGTGTGKQGLSVTSADSQSITFCSLRAAMMLTNLII